MSKITPKEIADWYFEKSREFEALGRSLEQTFNLSTGEPRLAMTHTSGAFTSAVAQPPQPTPLPQLAAEAVLRAMGGKKKRLKEIAITLGVSRESVAMVVKLPDSGMQIGKQGWVHLIKK